MTVNIEASIATRLKMIIGSESVAAFAKRSGVGESLLRKYLNGSTPSAENLLKLADAGAVNIAWLITGRPPMAAPLLDEVQDGSESSETMLLVRFRAANDLERDAVDKLLAAIANPGGMAWYRAGEAVSRIANIFPRKG